MKELIEFTGGIILVAATLAMVALFNGTILYFIYPHIHALFPSAAEHGIIAHNLKWWDSVCIVWIFTFLIKSSQSNSNDK